MRKLNRALSIAAKVISTFFGFFYLYTSGFGIFSSESHRGIYLLCTYILCLLYYPAYKKDPYNKLLSVVDGILIVLASISIVYWMAEYGNYASQRVAWPNRWDTIWGAVLIIVSLEVTRRVMGWVLATVGFAFVIQTYLGPYLPGVFSHQGMDFVRIIEFNYSTMEGIFGTILSVFATYVMPFLVFGAFLQKSGGGQFFIDLARAIAGRMAGGPALIAVFGSAVFGSMSGSPVANVVATGSFTIPMMKKAGFKAEFAGAVEAAASTGGQFLPPIMGAGAFILATFTETPYGEIVLMALVPALLYYLSVSSMVYFRARRMGINGMKKEELPKVGEVLKKGWYYAFTLVIAFVIIAAGFSPPITAFWASVFVTICSMFRKETRFTIKRLFETLNAAGSNSLTVGSTVGTLGLVMGGITLSGMGVTFSQLLLSASGGYLFLTIILIAIIATIVGMGLPTAASYIVMSILAAPSLITLGVPVVQAHMLCFWLALTSNITPPVCVAAFAAASVAESDPMKTGLHAVRLGIFLYALPFAFVYTPEVMLIGENALMIVGVVSAFFLATIGLAAGFQGWLLRNLDAWERLLYLISAVLLMVAGWYTGLPGGVLLIVLILYNYRTMSKAEPLPLSKDPYVSPNTNMHS